MELRDKIAIITGGSRGLGKAVASAFLREGAKVMIAARSEDELLAAKEEFKKYFGKVEAFRADVSSARDVAALIEAASSKFGEPDILVNAAGIFGPIGPAEGVDFDAWKKTFEINVFGMFKMIQAIIPIMKKNKLTKKLPLKVIDIKLKGKGNAVINGLNHTNNEIVGFLDADNPFDLTKILQMLRDLETHDMVIASKFRDLSKYQTSITRRFFSIMSGCMIASCWEPTCLPASWSISESVAESFSLLEM